MLEITNTINFYKIKLFSYFPIIDIIIYKSADYIEGMNC